ncbi:hypothetical protein, partial [Desulfobaculum bizertense]|uniref:hypothetical protein n=1 Tax=Desulfobaculum bizertense TaxID=376490 RepID=UPI001F2D526E
SNLGENAIRKSFSSASCHHFLFERSRSKRKTGEQGKRTRVREIPLAQKIRLMERKAKLSSHSAVFFER